MDLDPNHLIDASWIILGIVWVVGTLRRSPAARRQSAASRLRYLILPALCGVLLCGEPLAAGPLLLRFVPKVSLIDWAGAAITNFGAAFAIVARLTLGRNWSGVVSIKKEHQLIRSGPYAVVRHPIYSGILLSILGTAVTLGEVRGLIAFAFAALAMRMKSLQEERFMREEFCGEYQSYQTRVKAMIPFVW